MKNIFIILALVSINFVYGQNPLIVWENTYGGSLTEMSTCIAKAPNNEYIITGYSESTDGYVTGNHYYTDVWLVKTDIYGSIIWNKSFGGNNFEYANKVIPTYDGGFIVVGTSKNVNGDITTNNGGNDAWVIKTDGNGNLLWEHSYGGSEFDMAFDVIQCPDSSFLICCVSYSNDGDVTDHHGWVTKSDVWILRVTNNGTLLWAKSYGGTDNEVGYSKVNYNYSCGVSITTHNGSEFAVLTNTNSNDGDPSSTTPSKNFWLFSIDLNGNIIKNKRFGGNINSSEMPTDIEATIDGGYILVGAGNSANGDINAHYGLSDFQVIKIDSLWNCQWGKNLGGSDQDIAFSVTQASNGSFLVVGTTQSNDYDVNGLYGKRDCWLVNLNDSGQIVYSENFGGTENDFGNSVIIGHNDYIVVSGSTYSENHDVSINRGESDFWTLKLQNFTSIDDNSNSIPGINIYPNPSTGVVNLKFTESIKENYNVFVFNAMNSLVFEKKYINTSNYELNLSNHAPGLYFIKIQTGNDFKMIKQIIY